MAKLWSKLSAILACLATVGFIIGQALPYWMSGPDRVVYVGLWQRCVHINARQCANLNSVEGWWNAVRAMEVMADIFAVVSILVLIVYIRKISGPTTLRLIRAAFLLSVFTALCSLIGVVIFGAKFSANSTSVVHLDWSFALTTVAGGIYALIAVFIMLEKRAAGIAGSYISI